MAEVLMRPNIGNAAGFFTCEPSCCEFACLLQNTDNDQWSTGRAKK